MFFLATDGVHEFVSARFMINAVKDHAARSRCRGARAHRARRSNAAATTISPRRSCASTRCPGRRCRRDCSDSWPSCRFRRCSRRAMMLDGYRIVRELHASARSHVYLADGRGDGTRRWSSRRSSTELRGDAAQLERFLMEDWIARRIDNRARAAGRGPTPPAQLSLHRHRVRRRPDAGAVDDRQPASPPLETVRGIVEQIAKGCRRSTGSRCCTRTCGPQNVMIDRTGTVKIIDFGSTRVAGIAEIDAAASQARVVRHGAVHGAGIFPGRAGTPRSDLFSLGVIAYQMLSGRLPYGAEVARARTRAAQRRLRYRQRARRRTRDPGVDR